MESESSLYFDLSALLHVNGLDIRRIANDNLEMLAGEYFTLLTKFLAHAPLIKENLKQSPDLSDMEDMKILLKIIGCDTKNIAKNFDEFHAKINAAKRTENHDVIPVVLNPDEKSHEKHEAQFLHKAIKLVDHEEASRKSRILAVDDAPSVLKIISSALNDEYKVYGMTNPKMLEDFLKQVTPELFLLDYKMPELSGFDLIPIIKSFDEHKNTPIIFLTSVATAENVTNAFALGADDYIVKPFQGKQLREKINKHIIRKK